jgi:hypothetical protein
MLSGRITRRDGAHAVIKAGATEFHMEGAVKGLGESVAFCLRPEALRVIGPGDALPGGWASLEARISRVEFLGALTRIETQLTDGTMLRVALLDQHLETLSSGHALTLAYDPRRVTGFKAS